MTKECCKLHWCCVSLYHLPLLWEILPGVRVAIKFQLHRKLNQLWMIQYPTGSVSPEQQKRILQAIEQIKRVMEVDSMKAMYTQYVNQEKQSVYFAQVYKELKTTISQLKNEASMMPQVTCSLTIVGDVISCHNAFLCTLTQWEQPSPVAAVKWHVL